MTEETFLSALQKGAEIINSNIKDQIVKQGHHLTGALEDSLTNKDATSDPNNVILEGLALYYSVFVDKGVPADRIPFSGSHGSGGTSAYIQGLKRFAMLRFNVDETEGLKIAFMIANKHKKEGMPTANSYQFSSTGERLNFIEIAKTAATPEADKAVLDAIDTIIDYNYHLTPSETV